MTTLASRRPVTTLPTVLLYTDGTVNEGVCDGQMRVENTWMGSSKVMERTNEMTMQEGHIDGERTGE